MSKYWPIIIIVLLSFLILNPLFKPGYFLHHDDLQVMRIVEMRKCFEDLQLPCRWVPDMGYGYGYPLFNFYSVFPYYIGGLLSYILGYIGAAKALFFISLFLGYLFMYWLGKELFGQRIGFVVATAYAFAPYRALDSYIRGAVAESFALMLFPLILLFGYRLSNNLTKINFIGASLSLAALFTTHNIMTLFFTPVYLGFLLLLVLFNKGKFSKAIFGSVILALGLAAFFILPVFFETSLVQIDTLRNGGSNFRAHFVTLNQLFFSRFWGYGESLWGGNDTISFQIGWPHWWIAGISTIFIVIMFVSLKFKKLKDFISHVLIIPEYKSLTLGLFFAVVFIVSIFMTHNQSAFLYEMFDPLQFAQFSWRFLSLTILSNSLLIGFFLVFLKKGQNIFAVIICALVIGLNFSYFQPGEYYFNITDKEKLSGDLWDIQQKAGILDYLPKTAYEPKDPAPSQPVVSTTSAIIKDFSNRSDKFSFNIETKEQTKIVVPVFEFPEWQVKLNDKVIEHQYPDGFISFTVEPGQYSVVGNFKDTAIRKISNVITIFSILILIIMSRRFKVAN